MKLGIRSLLFPVASGLLFSPVVLAQNMLQAEIHCPQTSLASFERKGYGGDVKFGCVLPWMEVTGTTLGSTHVELKTELDSNSLVMLFSCPEEQNIVASSAQTDRKRVLSIVCKKGNTEVSAIRIYLGEFIKRSSARLSNHKALFFLRY